MFRKTNFGQKNCSAMFRKTENYYLARLSANFQKTERRTIAMNFIPYKVNEVLDNVFYQIPKELLINPIYKNLDSNSILLYGLLLDRLSK